MHKHVRCKILILRLIKFGTIYSSHVTIIKGSAHAQICGVSCDTQKGMRSHD